MLSSSSYAGGGRGLLSLKDHSGLIDDISLKWLAHSHKPRRWLYPCTPGQLESNEAPATALWGLYNRRFVKEEMREPGPCWGPMCRDEEVFPVRNILSETISGFLLLKSLSRGVGVCTKQSVVNSYRKTPERNRKSKDIVLEKYRAG